MTKDEFAIFAAALRTYYPKESLLPNDQAMELWFKQLQDIPYNVAEVTLNKWVALNKWSPSISDIREKAAEIINGESKSWAEAWEDVMRMVRLYGYYGEGKALDQMDDTTRKVVKQIGFRKICHSENIEADRANFRMAYEIQVKRDRDLAQMPESLKALISNIPKKIERGKE